jgi:outer membrane immunogenic protein
VRISVLSMGCAAILVMAGAAFAADLPSLKSAPVYAPPPAMSWTGFYLDAGAGYGEWDANTTTISRATGNCALCTNQSQGGRGFLGRVGLGFDYQLNDQFLVGVFGDGGYGGLNGTIQQQRAQTTATINQNWSWAAGARLGWLATRDLLVYGDAGFTQAHFTGTNFVNTSDGAGTSEAKPGFTPSGWFAGGGFETMFAPGWFFRTEYRIADYGATNLTNTASSNSKIDVRFRPIEQTVTTGLVYKFGWPGFAAPALPSLTQITDNFWGSPVTGPADWSGFYADAGIGYGLWSANTTTRVPGTNDCVLCVNQRQGGRGIYGTVGLGYDYQLTSKIVAGIFGDFDPSDLSGTIQNQSSVMAGTIRQNWAWSAGGRLGWLVSQQVMTYTSVGFSQARFGGTQMQSSLTGAESGVYTSGFTSNGWFLGGGIEAQFAPGWFWRAEYRYTQYGAHQIEEALATQSYSDIRFRPEEQTATVGLVYKFNWSPFVSSAPVVAKY